MRHTLFILYILLFMLLLLSGCISNEIRVDKKTYIDFNVKILTRGNGDNGVGDALSVSSVRIILFDKQGKCVANQKYTTFDRIQDSEENTIITVKEPISFTSWTIREKYDIYAVLNEEGFYDKTTNEQRRLSEYLNGYIVGTNCQQDFIDLLHMPLAYETIQPITNADEPCFIMYAHKEEIAIPDNTTQGKPYHIDLSDENKLTDRSMAIVYIDKITSDNGNEDITGDRSLTSRIFVKSADLINVPTQYVWNDNDNRGEGNWLPEKNFFTLSTDADGYVNDAGQRIWPGILTQTFTGSLYQEGVCERDFRCWRKSDNKGVRGWAIGYHNNVSPLVISTYNLAQEKRTEANNGNFVDDMIDAIVDELTSYDKYEDRLSDLTSLEKAEAQVSDTYWNISVNQGWYVPENISTSSRTATAIKIHLVIARPEIILPEENTGSAWMDYVNWGKGWKYYSDDKELINTGYSESYDFLYKFARICWHNDIEQIDRDGSRDGYHCFIGGLSRRRYGDIDATFNTDMENVNGSWKIDAATSIEKEFIIPINNLDFDNDYSIHRNYRYNVTLKVNKNTYNLLSNTSIRSKSSMNTSPIQASVEKIKLSEP